ncbi:peptidoglycan editing factor PgeF [Undibacterium terreum]|uniref:Purine nucleoside phosphorylase n=1 Tax=Undibacterium terreum TaxID=1224302 RepID=A0A916UX11_9BURK|nr:peptidoglycan editing factor PgeF [Undibacterium terreum]GGC92529.1 laccase domain protein [Undibacterium terreum]
MSADTPVQNGKTVPFDLIVPSWPGVPAHVRAFSSLRNGGVSLPPYDNGTGQGGLNLGDHVGDDPAAVAANRGLVRSVLPSDVTWLSQVHGTLVCDAALGVSGVQADACSTSKKNVVCAVMTADCLPVLFTDRAGTVVAAAHAGWRGLAAGVLENTLAHMRVAGAGEIFAWLGPAIGPEQFEVGEDVVRAFLPLLGGTKDLSGLRPYFNPRPEAKGKFYADIYALARAVLMRAGVQQIDGGNHCTVTEKEKFFSYRRDGVTGRMASLIWLE